MADWEREHGQSFRYILLQPSARLADFEGYFSTISLNQAWAIVKGGKDQDKRLRITRN
jgi:hypothetical protein